MSFLKKKYGGFIDHLTQRGKSTEREHKLQRYIDQKPSFRIGGVLGSRHVVEVVVRLAAKILGQKCADEVEYQDAKQTYKHRTRLKKSFSTFFFTGEYTQRSFTPSISLSHNQSNERTSAILFFYNALFTAA